MAKNKILSKAEVKANQRRRNAKNQAAYRARQSGMLRGLKRRVAIAERRLGDAMAKLAKKDGKS
jgi:hypothetical protein